MTSETDHSRQRTVAELLALHSDTGATGATGATGRRRRRREAEGADERPQAANGTGSGHAAWASTAPPVPDRSVLREPVPRSYTRAAPPPPAPDQPTMSVPAATPVTGRRRKPEPIRENPTDHIPRYREDSPGGVDADPTGPIVAQGPVGSRRTPEQARPVAPADDGGPPTQAASPLDFDDHPAGLDPDGDLDDDLDDELDDELDGVADDLDDDRTARRRAGVVSPSQAWAAVVAQWIVGAVGGAALWVGFRFLWRELPVVALAAAALVTVGLVLVVRALLRNNDLRTTVVAVLVGLLLTVSPAILVLLGR